MNMPNDICPRCGHSVPHDRSPGAHPGAISRHDNRTEVCSPCGTDEGMRDFTGTPLDRSLWFDVQHQKALEEER